MNKTKMTFRFDQQLPETSREDKLQVLPYKNESITNEQRETIRDKGLYQKISFIKLITRKKERIELEE